MHAGNGRLVRVVSAPENCIGGCISSLPRAGFKATQLRHAAVGAELGWYRSRGTAWHAPMRLTVAMMRPGEFRSALRYPTLTTLGSHSGWVWIASRLGSDLTRLSTLKSSPNLWEILVYYPLHALEQRDRDSLANVMMAQNSDRRQLERHENAPRCCRLVQVNILRTEISGA